MKSYWDFRFRDEGRIWGTAPSVTAGMAAKIFLRAGHIKKILVPGAGYGRNAKFFCAAGFAVTGVEISGEAFLLSRTYNPEAGFHLGSFLDPFPGEDGGYDAIYCYNVLHLFRQNERELFVRKSFRALREGGITFFVVFSEKEKSFGKGRQVEENSFESKPGRPVHYFTEQDLRRHFCMFDPLAAGIVEDPENHGDEGPHVHLVRYIAAIKPKGG